tara:strand:- start:152 stop:793 length:642 start_codon:yes stop_codon:yes gene_type:complete
MDKNPITQTETKPTNPFTSTQAEKRKKKKEKDSRIANKLNPIKREITVNENNDLVNNSNNKLAPILKRIPTMDSLNNSSENDNRHKSGKIANYCKKYYANHCRPQYSYPLESINWKRCNMKNWYKPYSKKYLLYKKDCKTSKNKKAYLPNISVGVKVVHKKFPYIWRFLNKKTQKKIIKLAQLPVNMIDIWPNSNNPVYIKKMKTIKQIINKN